MAVLFVDTDMSDRTGSICLMKLMASRMLSAARKRQYSSVIPLLCHYLPVFDQVCGMGPMAMNLVLLSSE